MRHKLLPLILVLACPVFVLPATKTVRAIEGELQNQDKELRRIRQAIEDGQKRIRHLQSEEKSATKLLLQTEDNLELTRRYLEELSEKEARLSEQIGLLTLRIHQLMDSLAVRKDQMKRRLRAIYKKGKPSDLEALLGAKSLSHAFERSRYFRALNAYDQKLLKAIQETRKSVESRKRLQERKRSQVREVRSQKTQEKENLVVQKRDRKSLLEKIKSQKSSYEELVKELRASRKAIARLIGALEHKKKKAIADEKQKKAQAARREVATGKYKRNLIWPTEGKILRKFGRHKHPKYKTITINSGIDIHADEGQPVLAVASGTVAYVGRMRGYGRLLILEHDGGFYSLYAHLSDILLENNKPVQAGQMIGRVGDTGSLEGSKLHFEFRKGKEVLNPEAWLPRR